MPERSRRKEDQSSLRRSWFSFSSTYSCREVLYRLSVSSSICIFNLFVIAKAARVPGEALPIDTDSSSFSEGQESECPQWRRIPKTPDTPEAPRTKWDSIRQHVRPLLDGAEAFISAERVCGKLMAHKSSGKKPEKRSNHHTACCKNITGICFTGYYYFSLSTSKFHV